MRNIVKKIVHAKLHTIFNSYFNKIKGFIMSIQSSKQLFFLALFATHHVVSPISQISIEEVAQCYDQNPETDQWKYLELYFIVEPNNQIQAASMSLSVKIGAFVSGLFLATRAIPSKQIIVPGKINDVTMEVARVTVDPSTLITTSILAAAAGFWYSGLTELEIKKNTLTSFLKNWSYHRNFIPKELVPAFDQLATYQSTINDQDVIKLFTIIQHLIEHTFTKRYPKEKKSTDLLGAIKTITDIGKNISPSK